MKKGVIIAIGIVVIIVALIVGVFVALNKEKIPMTTDSFKNTMEEKGFTVQSAKEQFAEYEYVKDAIIALNGDYQLEFYELSDVDKAVFFYNNNKAIFEQSKGNASANTSVNMKNSSKYTQSSNGKYMVVSRIDNTVIYLNVEDKYKEDVKSLLDELGY